MIMRNPQASKNKTGFLIESMSSQNAGLYQCAYASGDTLSELSEPLLLVVTGKGEPGSPPHCELLLRG